MQRSTVVEAPGTGLRLDKYLAEFDNTISRNQWKKLIESGRVKVNSQPAQAKQSLEAGDEITIDYPSQEKEPLQIPIIKRGKDYLVIDKPAGVLSHARNNFETEYTVADFASDYSDSLGEGRRTGIVHRLDRLTSGVMILALEPAKLEYLSGQFAGRKVQKTYLALVKGRLKHQLFIIDAPISRSNKNPKLFTSDKQGRAAKTMVKSVKYLPDFKLSVVLLRPQSGRTHQLRVHMKLVKHPIAGDILYGDKSPKMPRTMLHAYSLKISTGPGRAPETFVAKLPLDMALYIDDEELKQAADAFGHETGD